MSCRVNRSCIFLLVAGAFLLSARNPACAMITHPDGEPNMVTWADRPPEHVIGRWDRGSSCVAISPNCVITTRHQNGSLDTIVELAGVRYSIAQIWEHPAADLRMAKLIGANLPDFVDIYRLRNEVGKEIVMGGYGVGRGAALRTQAKTYGYEWDTLDTRALRFGTNKIETVEKADTLADITSHIITADFDDLAQGDSTPYESIPAGHDSGGGCLIKEGQTWKVAGLIRAVEQHHEQGHEEDPNYVLSEAWFRDRSNPNTPMPDYLDAVRVSSYAQWITARLPTVRPGDLNGDDYVNARDFAVFAEQWPRTDCAPPNWCLGADSAHDGDIDWPDLAAFARRWLDGTPPQ